MLENEKVIAKISKTKQVLVDRVSRIRQIDQEIYEKLDEDRSKEIDNNLFIENNYMIFEISIGQDIGYLDLKESKEVSEEEDEDEDEAGDTERTNFSAYQEWLLVSV